MARSGVRHELCSEVECPPPERQARCDERGIAWKTSAGRIPSPLPLRGRVFERSPRPRTSLRLLGVCRSTHLRGSARSFLKMKRGDPSHSRISAAVGLVMPAHLEGATIGIGDKVRPCTSLVDQFWIRSAIHSHGSTPDRKSRAVPRCERGRAGSLRRQTQPRDALNACSKGWREHRCDIKCRPEDRRRWRVSGTPGDERRQSHGTCTTKKTSGLLPQGLRLFRLRNGA